MLNTYDRDNVPLLMDSNGDLKPINFEIEPVTEVRMSCSATINGEFYIFGGSTRRRQISKIIDCSLQRVGDLPYELYFPACGTFKFPEERSMICFPAHHTKSCVRYLYSEKPCSEPLVYFSWVDGRISDTHPNSTFTHYATTLSNIDNKVVAVGSVRHNGGDDNNKGSKFKRIKYPLTRSNESPNLN